MKTTLILLCLFTFGMFGQSGAHAQTTSPKEALCPAAITAEACTKVISGLSEILRAKLTDGDDYQQIIKRKLRDEEFLVSILNSPTLSSRFEQLPFNLTFKVIELEDENSVLALAFDYKKAINRTVYDDQGTREKSYGFDFSIDGTATQSTEKNPRNFINAALSFSFSNDPTFDEAQAVKALTENYHCTLEQFIDNIECARILADGQTAFFAQIGDTFYFDYGIEVSLETDQGLDKKNEVISGFLYSTYEDFRTTTFMGSNSIVPSLKIAIDTVKPSADSPRSVLGDSSSFERVSAEFHVNVPLTRILQIPYLFSFNYRTHDELGASTLVKSAGLDSYRLRTYSLSAPSGLVVSYSSGRLPFDIKSQHAVEIGFKTYF